MSKITFRADDDLIQQLEAYDASKSEVMRQALRAYLEADEGAEGDGDAAGVAGGLAADPDVSLEDLVADRVDAVLGDRLDDAVTPQEPQDVNVNITIDGEGVADAGAGATDRKTAPDGQEPPEDDRTEACKQCGEQLSDGAVYCSNCGEKASHRVFCECGDELRSDWGFCPGCGRRTPAADVLKDP